MSTGSFISFNDSDKEVLTSVCGQTGYGVTPLLRRLLMLYASGTPVQGLPRLTNAVTAKKAKKILLGQA